LLWILLSKRADAEPATSIASFRNQIITLERATPGGPRRSTGMTVGGQRYVPIAHPLNAPRPSAFPLPRTRSEVRRRRRDVLLTLLGLDLLTMVLMAAGVGFVAFAMFVLMAGLTTGYVVLLVQTTRLAAERARKVRSLPQQPRPQSHTLLESGSVSS
jgi:hypothetical protein